MSTSSGARTSERSPAAETVNQRAQEPQNHITKKPANYIFFLLAFPILAFLTGCESRQVQVERPPRKVESDQRLLVTINGESLTHEDFDNYLLLTQGELAEELDGLTRKRLFPSFVTQRLLLQEAQSRGIEISPRKLDEYLARWVEEKSSAPPELVGQARIFLQVQKLLQGVVLSGPNVNIYEMQDYYEEHYSDFKIGDQARVLEIRVDKKAEADQMRAQIKKGDARTFRQLAQVHSNGVTAASGGELGVFQRGQLPREFEEVIFRLKPGDVSPVFQSSQGYHIFMLEEWIRRHDQKFHEVQDQIFQRLMEEKERSAMNSFIGTLLESSSIKIHDPQFEMLLED